MTEDEDKRWLCTLFMSAKHGRFVPSQKEAAEIMVINDQFSNNIR